MPGLLIRFCSDCFLSGYFFIGQFFSGHLKKFTVLIFFSFPVTLLAETQATVKPASVEAFSLMGALNMAMGLIVVIALILGLAWVLKKYARLPGNNLVDMKVLGGLSLGTREKAILIEVDNQRLLVGVAPGHIQTLYVLDGDSAGSNSFESRLEAVLDDQK